MIVTLEKIIQRKVSVAENLKENCMLLPNSKHYYCP